MPGITDWGGHLSVLTISPDRGTTLAVSCNRDDEQEMWQNLIIAAVYDTKRRRGGRLHS